MDVVTDIAYRRATHHLGEKLLFLRIYPNLSKIKLLTFEEGLSDLHKAGPGNLHPLPDLPAQLLIGEGRGQIFRYRENRSFPLLDFQIGQIIRQGRLDPLEDFPFVPAEADVGVDDKPSPLLVFADQKG